MGAATSYFLAGRGVRVLLCEKGRVAGEQSSRNWGWVRQQGRDRAELPIMMESNRIWRGLAEQSGEEDARFTEAGCLYLAESEAELARFESWYEVAREHQLDTRMLSAREAQALAPGIAGRWTGGMLTPSDGPGRTLRRGTRTGPRRPQEGGLRDRGLRGPRGRDAGGARCAVVTEKGRVRAGAAVLAAGAWSMCFAANAGIDLPQLIVRSTAARTHPDSGRALPNLSARGLAVRRRADGGYTLATGDLVEHATSHRARSRTS